MDPSSGEEQAGHQGSDQIEIDKLALRVELLIYRS